MEASTIKDIGQYSYSLANVNVPLVFYMIDCPPTIPSNPTGQFRRRLKFILPLHAILLFARTTKLVAEMISAIPLEKTRICVRSHRDDPAGLEPVS
jgi:hypothetical protein